MNDKSYKIETITDKDIIEQVLLLFDATFPCPLSEKVVNLRDYARKLAENAVVNIVSLENKIIGFIAYYCNDKLTKQAYLTQIAVAEDFRELRIGSALLELCIETSKQNGMEKLICEVDDTNFGALKFYAKRGFVFLKKASDCSQYLDKKL